MLCCSLLRNVIIPVQYIGNLTKRRAQPSSFSNLLPGSWNLTNPFGQELRKFRTGVKMMVDTGSTDNRGPVVYILPDKEEEGGVISGSYKREDEKLNCGYSSFRGKRASMEDFFDVKMSTIDGKMVCMFGIFDGHGGSRAAEYLKGHLFENLMKHPQFMLDTKSAIYDTYKQTDADFLNAERDSYRDDGSTASTAVLVGNHLYVANVGDSRTVISKAGKAIPLSEDHKPNRSDERKRIENAGGVIMWAGTWRVGGVLAMSRAFGNRMLKQYVVAEPEIQEQEINDDLELLVLASDGLWDVVPNEDAVAIAQAQDEPEAAARKLTETAFTLGSADNITCIVVKLNHGNVNPPKNPEPSLNVDECTDQARSGHVASQDGSQDIPSSQEVPQQGSQELSGRSIHQQGKEEIAVLPVQEQDSHDRSVSGINVQENNSQIGSHSVMHDQSSQEGPGCVVQKQGSHEGSVQSVHEQGAEDKVDMKGRQS